MNSEKLSQDLALVEPLILNLRGERVIIDADLARLYGVTTKRLNEQVKRNKARFPENFMFSLTPEEKSELVANCDRFKNLKHSIKLPYAFTEHGALMAATVLSSERATQMSVYVIRAFVKMRSFLGQQAEWAYKLAQLERRMVEHDASITDIIAALHQLMAPSDVPARKIGFKG